VFSLFSLFSLTTARKTTKSSGLQKYIIFDFKSRSFIVVASSKFWATCILKVFELFLMGLFAIVVEKSRE